MTRTLITPKRGNTFNKHAQTFDPQYAINLNECNFFIAAYRWWGLPKQSQWEAIRELESLSSYQVQSLLPTTKKQGEFESRSFRGTEEIKYLICMFKIQILDFFFLSLVFFYCCAYNPGCTKAVNYGRRRAEIINNISVVYIEITNIH